MSKASAGKQPSCQPQKMVRKARWGLREGGQLLQDGAEPPPLTSASGSAPRGQSARSWLACS